MSIGKPLAETVADRHWFRPMVHIWRGKGGSEFTEVASMPAGWQPKRVQYPVAHFVPGQAQSSDEPIAVVLRGVRGMALGTVEVRLV